MIEFIAVAPFMIGAAFLGLLGLLLTLYVIYDVLVNQETMQTVEKLIWIGIVLAFNIFGIAAYLIMVKSQGELLLDDQAVATEKHRIDELERLQALKEDGALTEEEFAEEKRRILDGEGED